jgi:hypothetical protein
LDIAVITIGEKRPFGSPINGQKNVSGRLAEIQKRVDLTCKRITIFGQFTNFRTQRRVIPGILEEPHKLDIPTIFTKGGVDSTGDFGAGQGEMRGD